MADTNAAPAAPESKAAPSIQSRLLATLTLGLLGRSRPEDQAPPNYVSRIDGAREVVETVVFVVVLVLLLKSFVAEAFVIPTGSMATTLWGYQKVVKCEQCQYQFPVNCSQEVEPHKGNPPLPVRACVCPNCRWTNELFTRTPGRDPRTGQRVEGREVAKEGTQPNTGDRVLVAKFLPDLPWVGPQRFQVVVFKYPQSPQENWVPMNYIKRLIGLGGETLAIHYGNLYILDPEKSKALGYPDDPTTDPKDRWTPPFMHENFEPALDLYRAGAFVILRKPPDQVLAERRIVYDNDFPAKDRLTEERWIGNGAWSVVQGTRGFATKAEASASWLRYRHLLRDNGGRPALITDHMGYNTNTPPASPVPVPQWVGDLTVETEVTVDKAEGKLAFELSRGGERFRAVWDLATGICTLYQLDAAALKDSSLTAGRQLDAKSTALKAPGKYRVRVANVDDRLTVWVNKDLPFGDGVAYTPTSEPGPTKENDLEPASVAVESAAVGIAQLTLWRDTYYTAGEREFERWTEPDEWAPLRALKPKTLYVQPGHYLCMGDNSQQSSDSRAWGLVPQRLMLGRALAVYYPFYFPFPPLNAPVNRVGPIK